MKHHFTLQYQIPDVTWAQHKAFHPGRAYEDEVLSVVFKALFILERQAWKMLMSQHGCNNYKKQVTTQTLTDRHPESDTATKNDIKKKLTRKNKQQESNMGIRSC